MSELLTAEEASSRAGVAPSTFRAYVARGQAPRPALKRAGVNLWELTELQKWRGTAFQSREPQLDRRVDAAARLSRARFWEESVQRDMAQIQLSAGQAQSLIDGNTPAGLTVEDYVDARHILDVHRGVRQRLRHPSPSTHPRSVPEIVANHADTLGYEKTIFEVKADMTVELVANGWGEILSPPRYDPHFWLSQDSAIEWSEYMLGQECVEIPEGI